MGLSFVKSVTDKEGAAIFMLHNGSFAEERAVTRLAEDLKKSIDHQVLILSERDHEGRELKDFYDINATPAVLIIRDNDQVAGHWYGNLPSVQHIAHIARQVNS